MNSPVPEPSPLEPESAPTAPASKKARKSSPKKAARPPESALPARQTVRTQTEVEPPEHAEERRARLRMIELEKTFEIHKRKVILYTTIGLTSAIVLTSIVILALAARPELVNFATASLAACLAGFVGYLTGKAESKSL
jgi:hypothetical protein